MSRPKPSTQEIERYYFEKFRQQYALPPGKVEYSDKPDVIIESSKKIGIEITNFYLKSGNDLNSEQRQNVLREEIIKEAHSLYLAKAGKKIEFSFGFNLIEDKRGLAQKIAHFVSTIEHKETGAVSPAAFKHIPEVAFIYLNAREYEKPEWRLTQVHSSTVMQVERLLEIIRDKEAKHYEPCDSYWLLIVIDFINPAQDQEITSTVLPKIRSNTFEKVIIYKTAYEQILEVVT